MLSIPDAHGDGAAIYIPGISLAAGNQLVLWVSANGSTYFGDASQSTPDFSTLARGTAVPWTVRQIGYAVEIVATGFRLPVNIAFVPAPGPAADDPLYYVTELYGAIRVVTRDGTVGDYATDLLNFNPTGSFPGSGEQGVAGVVVDPDTGDVFATFLYDPTGTPGVHYPKVVRFHSTDGGHTAATQTTILDMVGETQGQSHQISNLTIGPDGKLYVHMGDGFDASTAQDLDSFRGKILRMNLDGSAPSDNPFHDASDGISSRDYVYAYGFRNPFGGSWRAADGFHYEVENGPSLDRFVRVVEGQNFAWDGTDESMLLFSLYNWIPAVAPVNVAFIQPTTFDNSGFPASKSDHAFVAESGPTYANGPVTKGKRISEFTLDANGNVIGGPTPLIDYTGSGRATAVGLAAGPDGLYFTDLYKDLDAVTPADRGANVLRVRFVGAADFTADIIKGPAPLTVQFTDTSSVPAPTAWQWDFGDGLTSGQQDPAHTYERDGAYDVRLRVTGATGVHVAGKPAFVHVGVFPDIALIGGSVPPPASDAAIARHLEAYGFTVDVFDDDRANRPSAATLAADYNLVIVSSTTLSANVEADFRDLPVPLVTWEQALLQADREPLATDGSVYDDVSTIRVLNNTHLITLGLPTDIVGVFAPPARLSIATGPYGPGVSVLATRDGAPTDAAILAAESGATLLGDHVAPARRVFLFFEDTSWTAATPTCVEIFDRAVHWALDRPYPTVGTDFDLDGDVDLDDFSFFTTCFNGPSRPYTLAECSTTDFDSDGDADLADFIRFVACFNGATRKPAPGCF